MESREGCKAGLCLALIPLEHKEWWPPNLYVWFSKVQKGVGQPSPAHLPDWKPHLRTGFSKLTSSPGLQPFHSAHDHWLCSSQGGEGARGSAGGREWNKEHSPGNDRCGELGLAHQSFPPCCEQVKGSLRFYRDELGVCFKFTLLCEEGRERSSQGLSDSSPDDCFLPWEFSLAPASNMLPT